MSRNSKAVQIGILKSTQQANGMTIPASLLKGSHYPGQIQCGLIQTKVKCKPNKSLNRIYMTPQLLQKLGLKQGLRCTFYASGDICHIGPVIGLFVGDKYIRRLAVRQDPKMTTKELIRANRQAATILYFFGINDVNFEAKKVRGTYYDSTTKRWKKHAFPFPTVLYDRGSGMNEKRLPLENMRKKLENRSLIQKFNAQHYFDKWDLHQKLSRYEALRSYIPETILYRSPDDIRHMLHTHDQLYVKRLVSSNGFKILKIEKQSSSHYHLSTYTNRVKKLTVSSLNKVQQHVRSMYGSRSIILQEAIDIPKFNRRNYDLRATVQRNGSGQLEISDISVRLGKLGSPVTSTRTSSSCYQLEYFYGNKLGWSKGKISELRQSIRQFLFDVYRYTEQAYGAFGEMGIDFAVDTHGDIKFIECNAKPAKTSLSKSGSTQTIRKAFQNPLEYAKYLYMKNIKS